MRVRVQIKQVRTLLSPLFVYVLLSSPPLFTTRRQLVAMAWRSHGRSNDDLVNRLKANDIVTSSRVEAAMKAVDRGNYCAHNPYMDSPQGIGYQATISAPHMHAHALELLSDHLPEGGKVLDVGSGSGYLTACFAHMIGPTGCAVGIEHIEQLTKLSIENMNKSNPEFLTEERVLLVTGDGRLGYLDRAPFDCIHVGAATGTVPHALHDQLKPGGRLIVPVGPEHGVQYLEQHDKGKEGEVTIKKLMGVRYVPLCDRQHQLQ